MSRLACSTASTEATSAWVAWPTLAISCVREAWLVMDAVTRLSASNTSATIAMAMAVTRRATERRPAAAEEEDNMEYPHLDTKRADSHIALLSKS
jgi:hypothetical protein